MTIEGVVLNVEDGDAILVVLKKVSKSFLMLIDGGNQKYGQKVLDNLKAKCSELGKSGPDLIVCTHYDNDHLMGLFDVINYFKNNITEIWIHDPTKNISEEMKNADYILENIVKSVNDIPEELQMRRWSYLIKSEFERNYYKIILESLSKLNLLFKLIDKYNIPKKAPFPDECSILEWPEIKIIGPTRNYYQKVFEGKNFSQLLTEEILGRERMVLRNVLPVNNPCDLLKKTSNITPTNKASIIILIESEGKKLLFTGDAGIESLNQVKNYPLSIKDLTFLKVPHHGSNNNISKSLIDIMNPKIAYNSGAKHEDKEVIACLKRVATRTVRTTNQEGDLLFSI